MLAHSLYKFQPLDVGCFRALKWSYGKIIESIIRVHIIYISKEDFFPVFYIAHLESMIESNIKGGFRGIGLVLYNPDYVILQLDIRLSTPTSPSISLGFPLLWESKTLNNLFETQSQIDYINNRIVRH